MSEDSTYMLEKEDARIDARSLPKDTEIKRFGPVHRIMHMVLILAVSVQFFTGIPLRYSRASWAQWMIAKAGGVPTMGLLHRIGGLIFLTIVLMHLSWLIYYVFIKKGQWYGAKSMVFRLEDLRNVRDNIKYMLGLGPEPRFSRYNYLDKFGWFAVFWGSTIIGGSGLLLLTKNYVVTLGYLPAQTFNFATIIHSDEGILALGFIFIVHWYGAHWNPAVFPINTVVFDGIQTKEEMQHERPAEWDLLEKEPEWLEERLVRKPKEKKDEL